MQICYAGMKNSEMKYFSIFTHFHFLIKRIEITNIAEIQVNLHSEYFLERNIGFR